MTWQLAEAKNKLSEVVNRALEDGPQCIERRNDKVILLAKKDYDKLSGEKPSFKAFLLATDVDLASLDLSRDKSSMRDIDL